MSREKDQTTPHQHHLSSLVIRPTESGGGAAAGGGGGSDYETGEVHRDLPPYSRSNRLPDGHGYRMRAGSVSPVRHRNTDCQFSPDFVHPGGPPRRHGFGNGRAPGRYRDYSPPPYGRGRESSRFVGRSYDRPSNAPGSFKGEGVPRSNPNVQPREGDWICHLCNNLNFARRESCNNCKSLRYASSGSPRRGYAPPLRRIPGPPMDRSPVRFMNGHRSPPRGWARDEPRDFRAGFPHPRYEGRFPDPPLRRDMANFVDEDYRDRGRFDRPPLDWGHRDRGRETFLAERRGYERRLPSPPPPPLPAMPARDQRARDIRKRSRSPMAKDYRRNMFAGRGRR